jgi:hypothetical protein
MIREESQQVRPFPLQPLADLDFCRQWTGHIYRPLDSEGDINGKRTWAGRARLEELAYQIMHYDFQMGLPVIHIRGGAGTTIV